MRLLLRTACLLAAATFSTWATGADKLPAPVAEALLQAGISEAAVAVYAHEIDAPAPLLAVNADRAMNPASVMKLITTYAALEILSPAFTWGTGVYATGAVEADGETLAGDLILKGGGDPRLGLEDFWLLLRRLRETGLKRIRGDLVLDSGYFAADRSDPGAFDGRPFRAYNANPEALMVNARVVNIRIAADPEKNTVRLSADPSPATLLLVNRLRLASGPCENWRDVLDWKIEATEKRVIVVFLGEFSVECGEKILPLAPLDNRRYVFGVFQELWEGLGGTIEGGVREGSTPADARLLFTHDSAPLSEVVRDINKFSNNVMARSLFLTLGAAATGEPGAPSSGAAAIHAWLSGKRLDFPELILENGSGLSRVERVSARHLGALLLAAYASPVMPEYLGSLPILAQDGTLKNRLKESPAAGRGHIKTGLLDGVKTLAGYVLDSRGKQVAVVCLVNHPKAAQAGGAMDALLQWIYEWP